jgi:hypothetical protein
MKQPVTSFNEDPMISLQRYNDFLTYFRVTTVDHHHLPPSLLPLSSCGQVREATKQCNSPKDYATTKQPPESLPMIVIASETRFSDKQCLTMGTDLFDPPLCASLKSGLTQGTEVFEVVLDMGCSFAMTAT